MLIFYSIKHVVNEKCITLTKENVLSEAIQRSSLNLINLLRPETLNRVL